MNHLVSESLQRNMVLAPRVRLSFKVIEEAWGS